MEYPSEYLNILNKFQSKLNNHFTLLLQVFDGINAHRWRRWGTLNCFLMKNCQRKMKKMVHLESIEAHSINGNDLKK